MLPPGSSEEIDEAGAAAEAVILGLRLDDGLDEDAAAAGPLAVHLEWAIGAGLLERFTASSGEGRVRLTVDGRLLSNELFSRLV